MFFIDGVICVRGQAKGEGALLVKLLIRRPFIQSDPDYRNFVFLGKRVIILEAGGLFGAAGGVVSRVKTDDGVRAGEIGGLVNGFSRFRKSEGRTRLTFR